MDRVDQTCPVCKKKIGKFSQNFIFMGTKYERKVYKISEQEQYVTVDKILIMGHKECAEKVRVKDQAT